MEVKLFNRLYLLPENLLLQLKEECSTKKIPKGFPTASFPLAVSPCNPRVGAFMTEGATKPIIYM